MILSEKMLREIIRETLLEAKKKKKKKSSGRGRAPKGDKPGKICAKGRAWANRTYKKWSAYAAMGASRYCKDPNYGRKKKKKNEIDEILIDEAHTLADWRKENWTLEDGSSCGTASKTKSGKKRATKRCKPASKWKTMSKAEKKADNAKKTKGSRKGKQWTKATKKGRVTKKHTKG